MQRAGGMGNPDRQQSDSRASAEGKGTTCIKKKKGVGAAGLETGRQTGREREGTVGEMGKQGALSLQPLLVFGQQPAPPSTALREMERQGRRGWQRGEMRHGRGGTGRRCSFKG